MLAISQPLPQPEADRLDMATDQAISACNGDARATIRSLLVMNRYLESEICHLFKAVSAARVGDSKMSEVTYFVALPFTPSDIGSAPGQAEECRTAAQAIRRAEMLARMPGNVGAVAFSRSGDLATGVFKDARLIKKFGDVPEDLSGH